MHLIFRKLYSEYSKIIDAFVSFVFCKRLTKILNSARWIDQYHSPSAKLLEKESDLQLCRINSDQDFVINSVIKPRNIPYGRKVFTQAQLLNKSYTYLLSDAKLKGKWPLIYTNDDTLIKDSVFFSDEHNRLGAQLLANHQNSSKRLFKTNKHVKIDCGVLMFSKWKHFGHWLPEHLLKLHKINQLRDNGFNNIKLIMENDPPSWKIDILNKLGWYEDDILYWSFDTASVRQLIVPSYPMPNFSSFLWLKKSLFPNGIDKSNFDRIYLSRERYSRRKVENELEICELLQKYDFKIIYPETLSFEEQVKIFNSAKIIIGPHGSAFTNVIFSSKATIIEFFGTHVPLGFFCYSKVMGHDYHPLFCKDDGTKQSNMRVNPQELDGILKNVIQKNDDNS